MDTEQVQEPVQDVLIVCGPPPRPRLGLPDSELARLPQPMTVLGLDLSLTSTGVAAIQPGKPVWTFRVRSKYSGHERMESMRSRVMMAVFRVKPDLIMVEGPSLHSTGAYYHEGAGLWWQITQALYEARLLYVQVPPPVLKKYATGRGNADKVAMTVAASAAFREHLPASRLAGTPLNNDEADALWLAHAGLDYYGQRIVSLPARQQNVLISRSKKQSAVISWLSVEKIIRGRG